MEDALLCLTHRYYDPATGRFVNRDPIGYDGGINLYNFAGGNPVNNIDPDGTRPLTAKDKTRLQRLYYFAVGDVSKSMVNNAVRDLKGAIAAVPDGADDPANLLALWWSIDQLGNSAYGTMGTVSNGYTTTIGSDKWKCNLFVANAYAIGAGVGWDGSRGVPTNSTTFGLRRYPYVANDLATESTNVPHFPVADSAAPGDIIAFFAPPRPGGSNGIGHSTLKVGAGLLIYAGRKAGQLGTFSKNLPGHTVFATRKYKP